MSPTGLTHPNRVEPAVKEVVGVAIRALPVDDRLSVLDVLPRVFVRRRRWPTRPRDVNVTRQSEGGIEDKACSFNAMGVALVPGNGTTCYEAQCRHCKQYHRSQTLHGLFPLLIVRVAPGIFHNKYRDHAGPAGPKSSGDRAAGAAHEVGS